MNAPESTSESTSPLDLLDHAAKRRRTSGGSDVPDDYFIDVAGTLWRLPHRVWSRIPAIEAARRPGWDVSGSMQNPNKTWGTLANVTPAGFASLYEFLATGQVPRDPHKMNLLVQTANAFSMSLGTVRDASGPRFRIWKWWSDPPAAESEKSAEWYDSLQLGEYEWNDCVVVRSPVICSARSNERLEFFNLFDAGCSTGCVLMAG